MYGHCSCFIYFIMKSCDQVIIDFPTSISAQPLGHPEIIKKSLTECSAAGGQELFIIGKNFINKNCEVKLLELSGAGKSVWVGSCEIDKSLFHNVSISISSQKRKEKC